MDKIIKAVVLNKLSDVIVVINSNHIHKKEYYSLYHYFIYFYMQQKISDNVMYFLTYIFLYKHQVISIRKINDINYIMAWHILKNHMKNKTYILLNIYSDIDVINGRVKTSINFLKNNSKNMRKIFDKHKKNSTLKKIITENFIDYISHFRDKITQTNIMIANANVKSIWIHEQEIENRLGLIVKFFGTNLLQSLGIDIIDNHYFALLTFDEKITYYNKCLNIISDSGKQLCNLLDHFKTLKKKRHMIKHEYQEYINKNTTVNTSIVITAKHTHICMTYKDGVLVSKTNEKNENII